MHAAILEEAKGLGLHVTGHSPGGMTVLEVMEAGQDCVEHLTGFEYLLADLAGAERDTGSSRSFGFEHWAHFHRVDRRKLEEALANVRKHSRAASARVKVVAHDGEVELTVTDDGIGPAGADEDSGFGVISTSPGETPSAAGREHALSREIKPRCRTPRTKRLICLLLLWIFIGQYVFLK